VYEKNHHAESEAEEDIHAEEEMGIEEVHRVEVIVEIINPQEIDLQARVIVEKIQILKNLKDMKDRKTLDHQDVLDIVILVLHEAKISQDKIHIAKKQKQLSGLYIL
jgi:hypothetical protein